MPERLTLDLSRSIMEKITIKLELGFIAMIWIIRISLSNVEHAMNTTIPKETIHCEEETKF